MITFAVSAACTAAFVLFCAAGLSPRWDDDPPPRQPRPVRPGVTIARLREITHA